MADPITEIAYSYRDGNRNRWTLNLQYIGVETTPLADDWIWHWILSCENGDHLSGQYTGQYDHTPSIADILVPIAQSMVSTAVCFSLQGNIQSSA